MGSKLATTEGGGNSFMLEVLILVLSKNVFPSDGGLLECPGRHLIPLVPRFEETDPTITLTSMGAF